MATLITVKGARDDRRVVVSEAHSDHPGGEAWVVGDGRIATVALTPAVAGALARGDLLEVAVGSIAGTVEQIDGEPAAGEQLDQVAAPVRRRR